MRLAALVESVDHVCCRYRLKAFQPRLTAAGHGLELRELPRGLLGRFRIGSDLRHADAVVLQRKLPSPVELRLLRRRVQRLLFDFDDAIWLRDSYSAKGHASARRQRRFRATLGQCDAVIAGNDYLAEQASQWSRPELVQIIPTCVDAGRYPLARHDDRAGVKLVWIGSSSTLRGLESIAATLERIGAAIPGTQLKLICDRFISLQNLPVIGKHWAEATEASEIAAADIGISWIPDDPWSRGKCGLKVLQFMAGGLPVVANPVGVQINMVRHGETGFLVRSADEWVEAVRVLAGDPELRRRMGAAGRQDVEKKFSIDAGARRWLALLDGMSSQRNSA